MKAAYEKLINLAKQAEIDFAIDQDGDLAYRFGSSIVYVHLEQGDENYAWLRIFSIVALDLKYSVELLGAINRLNMESRVGKFYLNRDKLFFEHYVALEELSARAFAIYVQIVGNTANNLDETFAKLFAGRTFTDLGEVN